MKTDLRNVNGPGERKDPKNVSASKISIAPLNLVLSLGGFLLAAETNIPDLLPTKMASFD